MAERRKSPKKVAENRKKEKNSSANRKKKCAGNRKMAFLSHGKPEKFKIAAENGKHPKDNEKWRKAKKQGKKLRKAGKA